MITDKETNTVYFSDLLASSAEYQPAFNRLANRLTEFKIPVKTVNRTSDIWVRDFLPVQVTHNRLVQFRYQPFYLKKQQPFRSNTKEVNKANGFDAEYSNINLDGGNVVRWKDKVIITDRIFEENTGYNKIKLVAELEAILDCQVIIIPQHKGEMTGHADGMIRFIDESTVLVNDISKEDPIWAKRLIKVLSENGLDFVNLPFFEFNPTSVIGLYINFLEVSNVILLPVFEVKGNLDQLAIDIMESCFPKSNILPINVNEIAKDGGLLNCVSWNLSIQTRPMNILFSEQIE